MNNDRQCKHKEVNNANHNTNYELVPEMVYQHIRVADSVIRPNAGQHPH